MAERVHPHTSLQVPSESPVPPSEEAITAAPKPNLPSTETPVPPTGTYVIQIPKDQVYRVPPPENARRYNTYTRRKPRRCRCCCFLCWLIGIIVFIILLLAAAAGIFYLVFRPKAPNYSVESIAVKGMNLTSLATSFSPEFHVAVRADNGNKKIGIFYENDSSVKMFFKDVGLCNGALPAFYQPSSNVTVFQTPLKGDGINFTASDRRALLDAVNKQRVPLVMKLRAPVKIKVGSVKTWTIIVKVNCNVTVDKLTAMARIVQKDCSYGVEPW